MSVNEKSTPPPDMKIGDNPTKGDNIGKKPPWVGVRKLKISLY